MAGYSRRPFRIQVDGGSRQSRGIEAITTNSIHTIGIRWVKPQIVKPQIALATIVATGEPHPAIPVAHEFPKEQCGSEGSVPQPSGPHPLVTPIVQSRDLVLAVG